MSLNYVDTKNSFNAFDAVSNRSVGFQIIIYCELELPVVKHLMTMLTLTRILGIYPVDSIFIQVFDLGFVLVLGSFLKCC